MSKFCVLLSILLLLSDMCPIAFAEQATVLRVIDGDTFVAVIGNKIEFVRLTGIDTPELRTNTSGVAQCYAVEARNELKKIISKKIITINRDNVTKNRDIYGRYLRQATYNNIDISEYLVMNGFSRVYTRSPSSNMPSLLALQKSAHQKRLGIWKSCVKH